jgi:hypothetical protein
VGVGGHDYVLCAYTVLHAATAGQDIAVKEAHMEHTQQPHSCGFASHLVCALVAVRLQHLACWCPVPMPRNLTKTEVMLTEVTLLYRVRVLTRRACVPVWMSASTRCLVACERSGGWL